MTQTRSFVRAFLPYTTAFHFFQLATDSSSQPVEGRAPGRQSRPRVPAAPAAGDRRRREERPGRDAQGQAQEAAVPGAAPGQAERGLPLPQYLRAQDQEER